MKKLITGIKNGLHGKLTIPGDKSISHRAIMIGAISNGITEIKHFLLSDDCLTTVHAFQDLGVDIECHHNEVIVHGRGIDNLKPVKHTMNMGNSGTTTRLLSGILASLPFQTKLIGDQSLSKRPMKRISEPLNQMGAEIHLTNGHLPMTINGKKLHAIHYRLPVASAQVKSSIILAALNADADSVIDEPQSTRDHTERMLNQFSPQTIITGWHQIFIKHEPKLIGQNLTIPGDMSSAAFFIVAATLIPDSHIILKSVGINPGRLGLVHIIQRMGGHVELKHPSNPNEPIADLEIESVEHLKPIHVQHNDIPSMIDELPLVALLAAKADGISTIHGAEELRFKETDRIKTIVSEFQKLGIDIEELKDGFKIDGKKLWHVKNLNLDSHQDHRIGMTLAIAAGLLPKTANVKLNHEKSIDISYPEFFNDLNRLITK
ncbi:3-phosphoshikimate 1-carboxyvinyltransferase [Philodulcilactobacillus myokoensis]|uniref:3-phosphoshikimate 1-carboxyvinyltransferase n=2 Tax=Philodulcilactobacillus myokoensis TaxID=2929573 RepID=A0A9W6B4P1_9LACO|nr:3-phosphoshikimate 1-carboxyvinyltransferase [Philodulcilactobacillus myokoensis]